MSSDVIVEQPEEKTPTLVELVALQDLKPGDYLTDYKPKERDDA